jgi:hypothetical protein
MSVKDRGRTIVTKQEVFFDPIYSNRPDIVPLHHEIQTGIRRIEQSLHIQRFQIDNFESFRTPHT